MKTVLILSLLFMNTLFAATREGKVITKDFKLLDSLVVTIKEKAAEHLYSFLATKLGQNKDVIITDSISCKKSTSIVFGDFSLPVLSYECSMILDNQGLLRNDGGDIGPLPRLGVGN